MNTLDWIFAGYEIVSAVLFTAGLWMIFRKCRRKGWHALIPGLRYYEIGVIGGRESDGIKAMVLDLARAILSTAIDYIPQDSTLYGLGIVINIMVSIAAAVYRIRVAMGMLRTFRLKKSWIFLWILAKWIPALRLGYSEKYQPLDLGLYDDDELLAGTSPALIAGAIDDDPSDDGLVVHVQNRMTRSHGRKRYLLKDINLTVPNGSLVLLLGGSGAGKTTLINAINGYEKAKASIMLNGTDIYRNYKKMKYRIGYVPQQDLMRMNDSVMATLNDAALLRLPKSVSRAERKERLESTVETLGLSGRANGLVVKKSGGQKKRISIGMELIADPELFILDEPDSGLDGVIARELFEKLRSIADSGRIVIAVTHTPDRVADLFDKVIVLARDSGKVGRLAFYGSPDEAREFFERDTMEKIVMTVNSENEGGEGRAEEIIEKYAKLTAERGAAANA